jgi:hypothetical protein
VSGHFSTTAVNTFMLCLLKIVAQRFAHPVRAAFLARIGCKDAK